MADDKHKLNDLHQRVWNELVSGLKFKEVKVPDDQQDGNPDHNSSILVSSNLETAKNGTTQLSLPTKIYTYMHIHISMHSYIYILLYINMYSSIRT